MARGIAFPESTSILGAPDGMDEEVYGLPVYRDGQVTVSCWKLTEEEIVEIIRTGCVWLNVMGSNQPPLCVTGNYPFTKSVN